MENNNEIKISTGKKNIDIIRDGEKVGTVTINPTDILEAKKFYESVSLIPEYLAEFAEAAKNLGAMETADKYAEVIEKIGNAIDATYGKGTYRIICGESSSIEAIQMFFEGVSEYYAEESKKRKSKYIN